MNRIMKRECCIDFAIVGAVDSEVKVILEALSGLQVWQTKRFTFSAGKIVNSKVLIGVSGIGVTNASMMATCILENFDIGAMVSIGIAGTYPQSVLVPGDVAVAESEIYGDMGTRTRNAVELLEEIGIPLLKEGGTSYFNIWPADEKLVSRAKTAFKSSSLTERFHMHCGPFVTVAASSGDAETALALQERFGAVCENMEGAAVAQVAKVYGVPFFECRGISNYAGIRNRKEWKVEDAQLHCQEVILEVLNQHGWSKFPMPTRGD